ncbi:hypothetical protein GCM10009530_39000 [Microbispora corallina]|uniref:Uncharacterized protein n=1 Tax=Microbispora corallina TaxID=83302 RepID=A0ABQ4G2N6_9ACTN|nr:hypothetical protein [Microbispora corallina]GIH41348.1 hypothetical protein Mco01_43480 [Microbispora corallina]
MTTFWLDRDDTRYADQVRRDVGAFEDSFGDFAPISFACAAWRVATTPVMSPPYVRWHRRILSATCVRNTWDGTLNAEVRIAAPLPGALTASRVWWRDRGWQGWPRVFGQFVEPSPRETATLPFLRASLLAQVPVPFEELPPAPSGPDEHLAATAGRALAVLVRELDAVIAPIIAHLEDAAAPR